MAAAFEIRPAIDSDKPAIVCLARLAIEEPDRFPWNDDHQTDKDLLQFWSPEERCRRKFLLVAEGNDSSGVGRFAGMCLLQAAGGSKALLGSLSFVVAPGARGHGLAKRLCAAGVEVATKQGFTALRVEVPTCNAPAVRVLAANGFQVKCTLPGTFAHSTLGPSDLQVMVADLRPREVRRSLAALGVTGRAPPTPARSPRSFSTSMVGVKCTDPEDQSILSTSTASKFGMSFRTGGSGALQDSPTLYPGEEVHIEPLIAGLSISDLPEHSVRFSTSTPLPEGLSLDELTGKITGTAKASSFTSMATSSISLMAKVEVGAELQVADATTLSHISHGSSSGSSGTNPFINEEFATSLQKVVDVADLPLAPTVNRNFHGDWMLWMVHRVWLNDPELVELDFGQREMPLGHLEPRIAPKLMEAIAQNTHLEKIVLNGSNLQKPEAALLGAALSKNTSLLELHLESNCLDAAALRELAVGIAANPESRLEVLRLANQKHMGQFAGRPTEQAIANMMKLNDSIIKLGFECDDANWRNVIDRALLRNNDLWRRRHAGEREEDLPAPELKSLSHIRLQVPPSGSAGAFFDSQDSASAVLQRYLEENMMLPTPAQLQNFAKKTGDILPYTIVAPLLRKCRTALLDASRGQPIFALDNYGVQLEGVLRNWATDGEAHELEVADGEGKRSIFKSHKEPKFSLARDWQPWLSTRQPAHGGG